jgi:hypothetical protein
MNRKRVKINWGFDRKAARRKFGYKKTLSSGQRPSGNRTAWARTSASAAGRLRQYDIESRVARHCHDDVLAIRQFVQLLLSRVRHIICDLLPQQYVVRVLLRKPHSKQSACFMVFTTGPIYKGFAISGPS